MDLNQGLFKYIYYAVLYGKCMNVPFYVDELLKSQFSPIERLHEIQLSKIRNLIHHATLQVPYYKKVLGAFDPSAIKQISDIAEIPFITKDIIKKNPYELVSSDKYSKLTKKTTAGSTGQPFVIWKTADSMAQELSATWRGYSWAGIHIGDRQGRFWGIPLVSKDRLMARLIDFVANRKRCSAFSFDKESMKQYTEMLVSFRPDYFYGYVSMLTAYADYFKNSNIKPPFNLKCIVTTSEILLPSARHQLETIFSTKVFNEYGCGELGTIAHECEFGALHVSAENMIVEILDNEVSCEPGRIGEIVITELNNHYMPLIRYRTGDMASFAEEPCRCGRTLPVIENLSGRCWDMIAHKNGKLYHPAFFLYIFEDAKSRKLGIGQYKIYQMDYNHFKIQVVPEYGYGSQTEEYVRNQVQCGFDKDAFVEFEIVGRIDRELSGKLRQVVGMNSIKRLS